ncbi:hypothetical protein KW439_10025 [Vibrio fluvialis]|nr:hypothetical protein [Vibrio fluvialis]
MKLKVLDTKTEGESICYLCKVALSEYVRSIPEDYREFYIQRGIVSNRYLDHLANTVAKREHIPAIVLVAEESEIKKTKTDQYETICASKFSVLDGLQRTHRLHVINKTLELILDPDYKNEILDSVPKFSRRNAKKLRDLDSNSKLLQSLVELQASNLSSPDEFFDDNSLWIELWVGLNDEKKIKKMLLLNAGHKTVNIKHQLELIFSSVKDKIDKVVDDRVNIVKEKDISAIQYSKSRSIGQYHFSHIISSLISMSAGKIVNTNNDFVADVQLGKVDNIELIDGMGSELLYEFIRFLFYLDTKLSEKYKSGRNWIGREVVLVGIFGAIGAYSKESEKSVEIVMKDISRKMDEFCNILDLDDFENTRNSVSINKVNLGNVNKKAVYNAIFDILSENDFQGWKTYFGVE